MATNLEDFECAVRQRVNDPKADRHSLEQILKEARVGLGIIRELRPALFPEKLTITLQPGEFQEVPPGWLFVEPLGVQTEDPANSTGIGSALDETMARRFGKPACAPGCGKGSDTSYAPTSARPMHNNVRGFTVSPAVPVGIDAKIEVMATNSVPSPITDDTFTGMSASVCAALADYVAYRFSADQIESPYTERRAAFFCERFASGLNMSYQATARVLSGANLGMVDDDALRAQRDLNGILK